MVTNLLIDAETVPDATIAAPAAFAAEFVRLARIPALSKGQALNGALDCLRNVAGYLTASQVSRALRLSDVLSRCVR